MKTKTSNIILLKDKRVRMPAGKKIYLIATDDIYTMEDKCSYKLKVVFKPGYEDVGKNVKFSFSENDKKRKEITRLLITNSFKTSMVLKCTVLLEVTEVIMTDENSGEEYEGDDIKDYISVNEAKARLAKMKEFFGEDVAMLPVYGSTEDELKNDVNELFKQLFKK